MTPVEKVRSALEVADSRKGAGQDWQCPAHDDRQASLSMKEGRDGKVILKCHADCRTEDVIAALGLGWADLFPGDHKVKAEIVATYPYTDAAGELLYEAVRYFPKAFKRRRPDGRGGWVWSLSDDKGKAAVRKVLYRLPKVLETARAGGTVYVVEGEKDVHALEREGMTATTVLGGAEAPWLSSYTKALHGADVIVVADHDEAGHRFGRRVATQLEAAGIPTRIVRAAKGKDVADHLAAGLGLDELVALEDEPEQEPPLSPSESAATVPPVPTDPPALASDQRILDKFAGAVGKLGVVGEKTTAATAYLVLTSRLLDKQASLAVKGHSASGKSWTIEQTMRFFPREAVITMTAMSQRALIYSTEEYAHRTLVVYEAVALREGVEDDLTSYYIRSLLSEGRIEYPVTVRDKEGSFTTKTIVKEGPTNLIVTTTQTQIHAENETRVLSITTDDSRDQTARVLRALAEETEPTVDLDEWVALQRWLAAHGERRVTIPYAAALAQLIPPVAVRLRRDFGTVLALIRAHAVLHQCSRKRDEAGRIIADLDDYAEVHRVVADVVAEGVAATVSPTMRETVIAVQLLTQGDEAPHPDGAMAQHLALELRLDKSAARRRLLAASIAGYVTNAEDRRGKPGRWKPGEPLPVAVVVLPVADTLAAAIEGEAAGQPTDPPTGGTVARESTGESDATGQGELFDPGRAEGWWSR
jgi:5S rRNA maturation endonuclease (ribonuclease M5)